MLALLQGARLETLGSKFYTIVEVLNEVREKRARDAMAALPYTIETRVPSEESMKVRTYHRRQLSALRSPSPSPPRPSLTSQKRRATSGR